MSTQLWQIVRRVPLWAWPGVLQHQWQKHQAPPSMPSVAPTHCHWRGIADLPACNYAQVQAAAIRICAGEYPLFGEWVALGQQPAWQRDWQTGYDWQHPVANLARDIKRPWELARCQWLLPLAQAYQSTQDGRFAMYWQAAWQHFVSQNPAPHGVHWQNPMEIAIRAANWILSAEILQAAGWQLSVAAQAQFCQVLTQHGQYIAQHRELAWPRTNHLLADDCGLLWLGHFLGRDDWQRQGRHALQAELRRQVLPESVGALCYEGSVGYHILDCEMLLWTSWYAGVVELRPSVQAMLCALAALGTADAPLWGDSDSGRWVVFALEHGHAENPAGQDPAGLLALAQHWGFLTTLPNLQTTHFARTGWSILRQAGQQLGFTQGRLGTAGWGGHSHNDALSVTLSLAGQAFLVDAGSYTYGGDPAARNVLRGTAQHSTLQVGALEQYDFDAGDLFCLLPTGGVWGRVRATADFVQAGYQRLGRWGWLYRQRRTVQWQAAAGRWLLSDWVACRAALAHLPLRWRFVFAPDLQVRVQEQGLLATAPNGLQLRVVPQEAPVDLQVNVLSGWYAPRYNQRQPTAIGEFVLSGRARAQLTWVLELVNAS